MRHFDQEYTSVGGGIVDTYVGVAHDQRSLRVAALQLHQLLQRDRGHPGDPLPTERLGLLGLCLRHDLVRVEHAISQISVS